MIYARHSQTMSLIGNGSVLVTGGTVNSASLDSAELYIPSSNEWITIASMNSARYDHMASPLSIEKKKSWSLVDGMVWP